MIWLDICDEQGNSLYFDIHHVARQRVGRRWQHAVNGVCGNGQFEVEVLVEPGEQSEVTFVDLSNGAVSGSQLLHGVDMSGLESGLLTAATRHCSPAGAPALEQQRPYPHPVRSHAPGVTEADPVWQTVI